MKGRNLIVITCVIALSFTGVGYSAWSQGLDINSFFETGSIHVVFQGSVIESDDLCEITAKADKNVLNIYGTVAPESSVVVKYDIYNDIDSTLPVKYLPDESILPDGITLDQDDTVIEPGEYLEGNKLIILQPGENELILPFVQYNSSDSGGWRDELKICWNITVAKEIVEPELDVTSGNAITVDESAGDVPASEEQNEDGPGAEPSEDVPETEPPVTEPAQGNDPVPETDPNVADPEDNPAADTPVVEASPQDPAYNKNSNEETVQSETPTQTNDDSNVENNTENDEGSEKNVEDGKE